LGRGTGNEGCLTRRACDTLPVPDARTHRGAHPEDARLFAPDQLPVLRQASTDLGWLLDHGYAMRSALALVGDRHALTQRQRQAVARVVCSADQAQRRIDHEIGNEAVRGREVWIDGYNLLILVETALGGGVIFVGRDGAYRDLASLHGTYRAVSETEPALRLIGGTMAAWGAKTCRWFLDRPVSNSGRLRTLMLELAGANGWPWEVQLEFSPDTLLAYAAEVVATSDSVVLDRCARWFNAAAQIISTRIPNAQPVRLWSENRSP
jgi:hypothetical protein